MKKIYVPIFVLLILVTLSFNKAVLGASKKNKTTNNLTQEDIAKTNKYLSSLEISGYELSPEFNKNTLEYYIVIPKNINSINIKAIAEAEKEGAIVKITGNQALTKQENTVNVRVTAADGTSRLYTINVVKEPEVNLQLNSLKIEGIDITPTFNKDTYYYKASLEDTELRSLKVEAIPNNTDAKVEIIGADNIKDGENLINIVISEGKEKTIYQIDTDIDFLGEKEKEITNVITEVRQIINYVIIGLIVFAVLIIILIIIAIIRKKSKKNKEKSRELKQNQKINQNRRRRN